jgi:hypothetical protein
MGGQATTFRVAGPCRRPFASEACELGDQAPSPPGAPTRQPAPEWRAEMG